MAGGCKVCSQTRRRSVHSNNSLCSWGEAINLTSINFNGDLFFCVELNPVPDSLQYTIVCNKGYSFQTTRTRSFIENKNRCFFPIKELAIRDKYVNVENIRTPPIWKAISISISNPVNQLHEIHMPERMAYTWKWIQSLFCALLHWIRSVPGRCDDVVVVVRFGTYKVGFQVKDRASPELCGRNTSVMVFISFLLWKVTVSSFLVLRETLAGILPLYWNVCTAVGFSISVFLGCYGSVFAVNVHFPLPSCGCYDWRWRWVCVVKRWVELSF